MLHKGNLLTVKRMRRNWRKLVTVIMNDTINGINSHEWYNQCIQECAENDSPAMLALLGLIEDSWVSQEPDGLCQGCAFMTFTPRAML